MEQRLCKNDRPVRITDPLQRKCKAGAQETVTRHRGGTAMSDPGFCVALGVCKPKRCTSQAISEPGVALAKRSDFRRSKPATQNNRPSQSYDTPACPRTPAGMADAHRRLELLRRSWTHVAEGYSRLFVPRFMPWTKDTIGALASRQLPPGTIAVPCCGPGVWHRLRAADWGPPVVEETSRCSFRGG